MVADLNDQTKYFWRVDKPFYHLNRYGFDTKKLVLGEDIDLDTKIVILPKLYVPNYGKDEALKYFNMLKRMGMLLVYDADDDMWSPAFTQYMIQMQWSQDKGKKMLNALINELEMRRENAMWVLQQCDAVTVSTPTLANYLRQYTRKPVYVVRNAIDVDWYTSTLDQNKEIRHPFYVTVGWAGGARPQSDLVSMLEAWEKIAQTINNVKFVISGWLPDLTEYPTVQSRLIKQEWASIEEYANNMQVDIGCVCVGDSDFSRAKSTIKAWEFALSGALVIGSRNVYEEEPIIVCDTVQDWYDALETYIIDAFGRADLSKTYARHVRANNDLKHNWVYWADAYQKIENASKPVAV